MMDYRGMITSPSNPQVKRIRRLKLRKHRRAEGAFFVEGPRGVLAALQAGAPVERVVHAPELLTSELARAAIAAAEQPVLAVSAAVFRSLSERDNPTGIGAVVRIAERRLAELVVGPDSVFVALEGVADPGNLGTILRTMDAVKATGLVLVGSDTTDPYHPTAVKASLGALFTVPLARATWDELWAWAAASQVATIATSARAEIAFWQAGALGAPPLALLLGGEREGLDPAVMARADRRVTIPMAGGVSSLNLAVAAGLLLYEARRDSLGARASGPH